MMTAENRSVVEGVLGRELLSLPGWSLQSSQKFGAVVGLMFDSGGCTVWILAVNFWLRVENCVLRLESSYR